MPKLYGQSFDRSRMDRMKFARNKCEFCNHNGTNYRLECHHKSGESYELDLKNELTMHDVVIVCVSCHDAITDKQRRERFQQNRSYKLFKPQQQNFAKVKNDENDNQTSWNIPVGIAQQYIGRSVARGKKSDG